MAYPRRSFSQSVKPCPDHSCCAPDPYASVNLNFFVLCSTSNIASKSAKPLQNRAWEDFRREVGLGLPGFSELVGFS